MDSVPVSHGGDRLGPADAINLLDTAEGGCRQDGGRHGPGTVGRSANDDLPHSGHGGRDSPHEKRGDKSIAPARNIDSRPGQRKDSLPGEDARPDFDFEIFKGFALSLGEGPDIFCGRFQGIQESGLHAGCRAFDIRRTDGEIS